MSSRSVDFSHGPVRGNAPGEDGFPWFTLALFYGAVPALWFTGHPIAACVIGVPLLLLAVFFIVAGVCLAITSALAMIAWMISGILPRRSHARRSAFRRMTIDKRLEWVSRYGRDA